MTRTGIFPTNTSLSSLPVSSKPEFVVDFTELCYDPTLEDQKGMFV